MTSLAARAVIDARLFGRDSLVLCACSGGPDSTALLHALGLLRRRIGHRLAAVGIDHGLRPEAAAELALAEQVARDLEVPFERVTLKLTGASGIQARARKARHQALQTAARRLGASVIALGHTADDRAETVIMRLLRGAGPRGLAAMPVRAPGIEAEDVALDLVRPLIHARRSDVLAHVARHRLSCAGDPSNRDRRFLRTRVRLEVMPLLEELSPNIVEHLGVLAEALAGDRDDPLEGLPRRQRLALERALTLGRSGVTVRLSGDREVVLSFVKRRP